MSLGGPRRPSLPRRDSGDDRSPEARIRVQQSPGLVPAPLVGMGGAPSPGRTSAPIDANAYRAATEGDEQTDAHRALATICPYLVAEDGGWRAATPMREHRCTAVRPPAALSEETQRRLCLVEQHVTCPEYLAARQRRSAELARDRISFEQLDSLRFQPSARATPVALERPRTTDAPPAVMGLGLETRSVARSARMPIAIGVIVVVALFGGSKFLGGSAPPSASPSTRATSSLAASPSSGATPSDGSSPTPSLETSPSPTPVVGTHTYKIKRGDSLGKIARALGTTVDVLKSLNDFGDPPRIRVGQVINVP
jgi:hypothetical protein